MQININYSLISSTKIRPNFNIGLLALLFVLLLRNFTRVQDVEVRSLRKINVCYGTFP